MRRLGRSSVDESSQSSDTMQCTSDMNPWSESTDDFGYPEKDVDTDNHPPKRRQRRQRLRGLHSFNAYVAHAGIVAIASSASMLTQQMESMARVEGSSHFDRQHDDVDGGGIGATLFAAFADFKSCFGSALGGVVARVGELISNLVDAIGEPPQRFMAGSREEQEMPILLPLAINLCILCTLASLFFFIFAFCSNQVGTFDTSDADDIKKNHAATQHSLPTGVAEAVSELDPEFHGFLHKLGVFILSLVTGGVLGYRHPVTSAVLCGC